MEPSLPTSPCIPKRYDVVILGGAFSGSAAAVLLRRDRPELSVLVVEKATAFDAKVGEATTEMSGMFLTRRLALWRHLELEHLPKEGLRYWFSNEKVHSHAEASESGPYLRSTVPSFQLRRDVLDEHILATAVAEGAELARPARVRDVELGDFDHRVTFERDGGEVETVACRWVLDATGRATFLGKRLGLIERNQEHPTAAVWCRWENVRHIDDVAARGPLALSRGNVGSRRLSTNHYMGFGSWTWFIPLGHGATSVGVVFDTRIMHLDRGKNLERDYLDFLRSNPLMAELLEGARMGSEDLRTYSNLAYVSRQYMGNGWALLGDAAAFLDPYYSPGLDHASFTVEATVEIVKAQAAGEDVGRRIAEHNEVFLRSYRRFFDSIYKDKYFYMGEHDLLTAAFLIETAQYYIFVVIPSYRFFGRFFWMPVLGPKPAFLSYHVMRIYNRRFKALALTRRAAGEAGRRNDGRRISAFYNLQVAPFRMFARGLKLWALAELDGIRLAFKRAPHPLAPSPTPSLPPGEGEEATHL
ncbi:MAG TPA: NAD(P)/FAD-dependent oxidoreductase [Thermoanaerobaculia bacterium]|nr:NAD(P)/FAD-dependent oxidoreductase [Thermoanaerobaculia bacterium]